MKVVEWIMNVRATDIWPAPHADTRGRRWPYAFITHCCINGSLWERSALCNTFSEKDTLKLYLDPLKHGSLRRPEIGDDYETRS